MESSRAWRWVVSYGKDFAFFPLRGGDLWAKVVTQEKLGWNLVHYRGETMGLKVTEGRPGRKPLGQRQWWLQLGPWWRVKRKPNSGCVWGILDTEARGEGPG